MKSHHTNSGAYSSTSCLSLPMTDAVSLWRVLARGISTDRRVGATFPHINSEFFKLISKTPNTTTFLIFGPVTWCCWLKCRIFLNRQLRPAHGSPKPSAHWIITFSTGEITVSKHDARPREPSPPSGVGGVSGLGPGYILMVHGTRIQFNLLLQCKISIQPTTQ